MSLKVDPYRIMFPIGLIMGLWGVSYWGFFAFGLSSSYPSLAHANTMIGGFLFLFALGFLMTAIPAFTDTSSASPLELGLALALSLFLATSCVLDFPVLFHNTLLIQMIALLTFGIRRFLKRKENPPASFLFVGLGLMFGLFGAVTFCLQDLGTIPDSIYSLGRALFYQGMMLSLVLGVGSRLLPALMGWEELPNIKPKNINYPLVPRQFIEVIILVGLIGFSFIVEVFVETQVGRILRALGATIIAFRFWKLHKLPLEKSWLSRWLWLSGWCVVSGLWGSSLLLHHSIHFLHVTFIGGFSLMTLMIATRVTLAHGEHGYDLETTSKALMWSGILIFVSMLTRLVAPFTMAGYVTHLGYASITWVVGILIWSFVFFKKILVLSKSEETKSKC